ncbi:hypothetical protein SEA_LITTLEFELLA_55 [Gordonia phage LittleFella]|nr:hypothetical protein SEA_LITTLEFELLA_55 [Gordonia phage LittleFella]
MSVTKANRFIETAMEAGWETRYKILDKGTHHIEVTATRGPEKIVISWVQNQLNGPGRYTLHDMEVGLRSAKVANATAAAPKPDMDRYATWQRRNARARAGNGTGQAGSSTVQEAEYSLPFDIDEDEDSTILKAIRGNTIVFKNTMTGLVESCHVPWRISDGKGGVRVFNRDLENVFYLAENEGGRAFLSFMDVNGQFRAVHLDRLIGVV